MEGGDMNIKQENSQKKAKKNDFFSDPRRLKAKKTLSKQL